MTTTNICVYDFTIPENKTNHNDLIKLLQNYCKKWTFQLEEGESGYKHYQGRFSLKVKSRKSTIINQFNEFDKNTENMHLSPTCKQNQGNDFYVSKEDTRLSGPWKDTDEIKYIPRQIREIKNLHPWQQHIVNDANVWNTRNINWVINEEGNIGKSILRTYLGVHEIGRTLPFSKDYRDIMRMVMGTPPSKLYIIDIPRAINKNDLGEFLAGIETLKDGYAWDDRYKFQEKYFDCPNIWIFSNMTPNIMHLSLDRWRLWEVENNELKKRNF